MSTFAVIDVGSNGIRFGIATVTSWDELQRTHTARQAIRLGHDVFVHGRISQQTQERLLRAFIKFRKLTDKLGVTRIEAVATSAMREARHGKRIVREIQEQTGITIRIIDGLEEARLLLLAVQHAMPPVLPEGASKQPVLLIDIGGGSVELTVLAGTRTLGSTSMQLGAVRLLEECVKVRAGYDPVGALVARHAAQVGEFFDSIPKHHRINLCVGTGGNVESLGKMRVEVLDKRDRSELLPAELDELIHKLVNATLRHRIEKFNLRPDRADVILPAAHVLRMIVQQAGVEKILIPRVGLKDGLMADVRQTLLKKRKRTVTQY